MTNRRQAFRPEPIEVDLGDRTILATALPWEKRNDFGNAVIQQSVDIINNAIKVYVDPESGTPELQAILAQKYSDGIALLREGLEESEYQKAISGPLYVNQVTEILLAIAEVNVLLDQLKPILDPNSQAPTSLTGIASRLMSGTDDSQKIESGLDSSSPDSAETQSAP